MGMKCLIIAAGEGSRLRQRGDCKPLIPILGLPLIERVIRTAIETGADDFFVVIGYREGLIRSFLADLAKRLGVCITPIFNEDWEKENGLSVLKAKAYLRKSFLLLMADHLFDPSIARNSIIDMKDVTRVKTNGRKILDIGKGLTDFNAFDTGIFLCAPAIFSALERSAKKDGDTTLSEAVQLLAADGKAKTFEIHGRFWIDVGDPAAFSRAEDAILTHLRHKPNDGPVARYINRPCSTRISRRLVNYQITPNQISLFSFLCSVLAAGLFALNDYFALLLGGIVAQFASIVDGCDGEVARLKHQNSPYGGWFDAVLDRYADAFLLFGLTWHAYAGNTDGLILLVGFLAIIGSFMLSYTADKHDSLMRERIGYNQTLRMGRDIRIFLIFLGAVFNQAYLTLIVIAVVMNIETMRRLIICRDHG